MCPGQVGFVLKTNTLSCLCTREHTVGKCEVLPIDSLCKGLAINVLCLNPSGDFTLQLNTGLSHRSPLTSSQTVKGGWCLLRFESKVQVLVLERSGGTSSFCPLMKPWMALLSYLTSVNSRHAIYKYYKPNPIGWR